MVFLSFARNLFVPPAVYGIGSAHPIRSLSDALGAAGSTGRDRVVFVNSIDNNGSAGGGEIQRVITTLSDQVRSAGKDVLVLTSETDLATACKANLRGVTPCYGAVVFRSSPSEGSGGMWNYTLRADSVLGAGRIDVDKDTNDGEIYMLPLQHAVDRAITSTNNGTDNKQQLVDGVDEYPFTSLTQQERADRIRVIYQSAIMNWAGVAFFEGVIGICYHMTGFMASERETGMATLVEAMMSTRSRSRWEAQVARLWSYHLSFSILYLPGWVIGSLILWSGVFTTTSALIVLFYHILVGLALASMSIFGAAFFKRSQLSGVTVTIAYLLLAIIAQTVSWPRTGTVAVLSLLFAPCNYTYFITLLARFEQQQWRTDLTQVAPNSPWSIPGIVLWVFLVIQILVYPVLGAMLERYFHGTTSTARNIVVGESREGLGQENAVQLEGFTKVYKPGFIRRMFGFIAKPKEPVTAVNNLTLSARRGQILALLGANGSGKSTTLDSIAGTNKLTSGKITIDGTGGLGIAPQKNVLWDELTVEEHIRIFNRLKSPNTHASMEEIKQLIVSIDLEPKRRAQSKTLSGGQKRKLQLGMMLTGGSAVCCVDEVSSGLDPLSRRKIWDILLAERGKRTIILTTHFLDEADLLADHIAILSKGTLRAEGSSVELKDRLGGGYRIHVHANTGKNLTHLPAVEGVVRKTPSFDEVMYVASSSAAAAKVIKELEALGISDYRFSGPTIEDVFLQLAEEVREEEKSGGGAGSSSSSLNRHIPQEKEKGIPSENVLGIDEPKDSLELLSGQRIGFLRQTWVLFGKRVTIFKSNWFPYAAAFFIPIIAAGLVTLFIKDQQPVGCSPADQSTASTAVNIFGSDFNLFMVGGPADKINKDTLTRLFLPIYLNSGGTASSGSNSARAAADPTAIFNNLTLVNTLDEFNNEILNYRKNVTSAGFWLGDANSPPTLAYKGSGAEMFNAWFGQWVMDMVLTNTSIASTYLNFDIPASPEAGNSLQLIVYVGLALCAYPGFFALYPNLERRRNVRGLQYSNGVSPFPLWLAYTGFDFAIVLLSSAIVTALFAGLSNIWYHVGYIFVVFMFYGLASILLAYNISLFCANQLSAYAFTAAGQAVMFLVYLVAYLCTITYAPVNKIDGYLLLVHFVVSAFSPIGSVMRAMFLALNLFSTTCSGNQISTTPGGILQYGGPILYLIIQSILLFLLLLWLDGGNVGSTFKRLLSRNAPPAAQDGNVSDEEVANELVRVTSSATNPSVRSTDGLRVVHLTKTFGKNTAVDNVTFGIKHAEIFALLGPNGAGKSTTISCVRGDLKPDLGTTGGDVFVEDVSVTRQLRAARGNLGVCPQFDAVDQMTVLEHLYFYARVRGIPESGVHHNVDAIIRAVGLQHFRHRPALALSGGNKRKLSLGIALMGNPSVILLDEPSSGLDAAAKRIMWRTLAATTVPYNRSVLLTTHSMEEADALAGRAGIMARRMLAMGTTDSLRRKFVGDALHVHLVLKGAPRTSDGDVQRVREWVTTAFVGVEGVEKEGRVAVEEKAYHGQMRFSVPAAAISRIYKQHTNPTTKEQEITGGEKGESRSAIGQLVVLLEENREHLGIEHYSVSPTTLDQVFLAVVGRHNVREEGYETKEKKKKSWWRA
ncbi:hypothetical protein QBC46DRAFT_388735 [Diplogelasinospora grovesii]|uniref:ABC transporter domain-containing protein n=1 Tax=Diplogelasinospora grovesii TaxID=303347 RepID=A0AAN6N4S6_9PEZI|nr:hypothetical protein QBC46DRAFT_388735 [Diplogelasinospora grovesii]